MLYEVITEKHALAFRLDPRYLDDLGEMFTSGLPPERPFRVTFFFTRNALGFHVGFSDIARGGWRTVIARTWDDVVTADLEGLKNRLEELDAAVARPDLWA